MVDQSIKICEVKNNPAGRAKIESLREGLKDTPYRVVLYGRYTGRKRELAKTLWDNDDPYCYDHHGVKLCLDYILYTLKGRVPLHLCQRIAVYVKPRPKTRWVQNDNGNWNNVPTRWA